VFFTGLGADGEIVRSPTRFPRHWLVDRTDQLTAAAAIGASEERIRLARDLHDGLLQSLTGVRLELRALQAPSRKTTSPPSDVCIASSARWHGTARAVLSTVSSRRAPAHHDGRWPPGSTISVSGSRSSGRRRLDPRGARRRTSSTRSAQAVPLMVHEAVVNAMKHAADAGCG
jgi:hypothetical protein